MVLFAKKLRFLNLFCAALLVLSIVSLSTQAMAGEYHATVGEFPGTTTAPIIACSQCHTMHGTQGGTSMIYPLSGTGVQPRLLRASTILGLCLYCHRDNTSGMNAPDVEGAVAAAPSGPALPSAGRFSDRSVVNYQNMHDMDVAVGTPPGNTDGAGWTAVQARYGATFNCLYCHDHHGNRNYRNLRFDPGNPANDSVASTNRVDVAYRMSAGATCSDGSATPCDVDQTVATGIGLTKYERGSVTFRRAPVDNDAPQRGISNWCGKCHNTFSGASGAANMGGVANAGVVGSGDNNSSANSPWIRHPVGDINMNLAGNDGTSPDNLHVDSVFWDATVSARVRHIAPDDTAGNDDEQPMCLSCHYAHGGGNPNYAVDSSLDHSNLVYLDGANVINIDTTYSVATGSMRNTCQQCHNQ